MKYWKEEQILLKKLIEKYCEIEDRNRLIKILEMKDRFLYKYFINEFSKLKIPNKMTSKELEEYEKKLWYIFKKKTSILINSIITVFK